MLSTSLPLVLNTRGFTLRSLKCRLPPFLSLTIQQDPIYLKTASASESWLALHSRAQMHRGIRWLAALCYLGRSCCCSWGFRVTASFASTASPVFPSWRPWAWKRPVIMTKAQSAGTQEPKEQNRQTVEGICCALDMIWISHASDSWNSFLWVKGESRLHSRSVCSCV